MKQSDNWKSELTNDDASKVNDEKIAFVYENGINILKEISDGKTLINTRTTLLLTYLASIVVFLVNLGLKSQDSFIQIGSFAVILEYVCLILGISWLLIMPKFSPTIYNQPRNFLKKDIMSLELRFIKLLECENLQHSININSALLFKRAKILTFGIIMTFSLPLLTFLVFYGIVCGIA